MEIETLLHDEIKAELKVLEDIDMGTDKYEIGVNGVSKLIDKAIELDKINMEHDNQIREQELKEKQIAEEKKDRMVKNGISVAGIVIPTVVTIWGTIKSLKFEETGTVTTLIGRGFINKLLPKK